jgi:maltose O-acetyltransferase
MAAAKPRTPQTEREKMTSGQPFTFRDAELSAAYSRAQSLLRQINVTRVEDPTERRHLIEQLLASAGAGSDLKPPFQCDYGFNIAVGMQTILNYGCVVLDSGRITIGDHVWIGPSVQIYTVDHPLDHETRRTDLLVPSPVEIGDDVWIGGASVICPGVKIGSGSVVGAGSVVTRAIPPRVFAAGNPCTVRRRLPSSAKGREFRRTG